jgi:hypothetical protein
VHVLAARVEPAAQALAGSLQRPAVLEEVTGLDAVDPDVSGMADLVVGAEGLRIVRGSVTRHEVQLPPAEAVLDLREDPEEAWRDLAAMAMAVAEEARQLEPIALARDAVRAEGRQAELVAAVRAKEQPVAAVTDDRC